MNHMTSPSREHLQDMARGIGQRQVRLVTGTIMFAYLISHFLNHALGNISTEALAIGVYYTPNSGGSCRSPSCSTRPAWCTPR